MDRVVLGRTGLEVSVAGLGCGGHSRLGQAQGHSVDQSVRLVHAALAAGVTFFDTAAVYGTEEILGAALKARRSEVVISSKQGIVQPGTSALGQAYLSGREYAALVEGNLKRLGTDYIDVFHLHGVMAHQYGYCVAELLPALERLKHQGKIRHIGLTERFVHDTGHAMLRRALQDPHWDVVMTGFNFINPSARGRVLSAAQQQNCGTLIMFAVRRALSQPKIARELVLNLAAAGEVDARLIDKNAPLEFLLQPEIAQSLTEAAYRFCRHEPGADVILTGTGSQPHLEQNLRAISAGPLPGSICDQLRQIFGNVTSVSGN